MKVSGPSGNIGGGTEGDVEPNVAENLSSLLLLNSVYVRDRVDLESSWIQIFLLFIGLLSILSVGYVVFMFCLITFHHYMRDPSSYVIPPFISNAYQFSSEEESFDEEEIEVLAKYEDFAQKAAHFRNGKIYFEQKKPLGTRPGGVP